MSVVDKLKLYNHEAERIVLGAMIHDEEFAFRLITQLENDGDSLPMFHYPQNRVIYHALRNVLLGIEPLNLENLLAECRKVAHEENKRNPVTVSAQYLDGLSGSISSAVQSVTTIHRYAWMRNMGEYAEWFIKAIQLNPDPNEFYSEAHERFRVLAPEKKNDDAVLYGWDTIEAGRQIQERRRVEAAQGLTRRFDWPIHWPVWNEKVRPLRGGLVALLAAPDGVGKSTALEEIAEHWAQKGNKVVLVHLEDNHEYKLDRRKARYSRVSLGAIEDGTLTEIQEREIAKAEREIAEWAGNLHYVHAPGWSMAQVLARVQKLIDEGECEALVVDYIDKCNADRRQVQLYGSAQFEREGDDMEQLKDFGERNNIPAITATQGNKEMLVPGKRPTRKDINGSQKKSARSQLVILMTRAIVGKDGLRDGAGRLIAKEGDYSPVIWWVVDKQNRGWTGTFHQMMHGPIFRIADLPKGFDVRSMGEELWSEAA